MTLVTLPNPSLLDMTSPEIIRIIDEHLISTGKRFIGLRAAKDLLIAKGISDIDLKALLEVKEIPHAFQTDTKPRQWRIPHSDANVYKERRKEYLGTANASNTYSPTERKEAFSVKHLIILLVIGFVLYSVITENSSSNGPTSVNADDVYIVNTQSFATYNKNDFDDMYSFFVANDLKAVDEMRALGKIVVLEPGTEVLLVDAGLSYNVIRRKGRSEKLWVASERVNKR